MKEFGINLIDGHLIFEDLNNTILVDTGSSITICKNPYISFMGQTYEARTSVFGNDIDEFSKLLGHDIDVLMGLDILEQFSLLINYKSKKIVFSQEQIHLDKSTSLPMSKDQTGALLVTIVIEGKKYNLAIDTGAKISYINRNATEGCTAIDTRLDFSPMIGRFKTPIFEKDVMLADKGFIVSFGNLPNALEIPLTMMGIDGVIGYDLFNKFVVLFNFKSGTIHIR
jgi:hypothetical protein